MKFVKTASIEELQIVSRFESLRKTLLCEQYALHLEKPLAYWAVPTDRRLPLAFLGRTLSELLNTPFAELSATPGIGQKKIRSFVKLLSRVASTDPSELVHETATVSATGNGASPDPGLSNGFDPSSVSEVVWCQWRASAIRHGMGKESLGRFAPSLKNMTRVVWSAPLETYAGMSLAEIRTLKTHGEKRVRAILEVFHAIHAMVCGMGIQGHLVVRIAPRLIDRVETWVGQALQTAGVPSPQEIFDSFVHPLLSQVQIDTTRQIANLAENRLGIHGPVTSVRQAARAMGLTRARVYQLLNEVNDIMSVRWPLGRHQVYELSEKFSREASAMDVPPDLTQFLAAVELFYPGSRRGAAGPLERIGESDDPDDESLSNEDGEVSVASPGKESAANGQHGTDWGGHHADNYRACEKIAP